MSNPAGSRVLLALVLGLGVPACAAPTDDAEAASSEDALTSLPTGHYQVDRKPLRGSYVKSLTLLAGKKYEMEFVRVRTSSSPWVWWLSSREETAFSIHGTYALYDTPEGQRASFSPTDVGAESVSVDVATAPGQLTFTSRDGSYTLKSAPAPVDDTKPLVAACTSRHWEGTLRFEGAGLRRGSLRVDRRLAGASNGNPNVGTFPITFVRTTGVEDYMAFEGADTGGNQIEFAVKKSSLEGARGSATFEIGLGYQREYTSYFVHQTLSCTVTR